MQLRFLIKRQLDELVYYEGLEKPNSDVHTEDFRNGLIELLSPRWDVQEHRVCGEDREQLDAFLKFFANVNGDRWVHFCPNKECCSGRPAALKRARTLVHNVLLKKTPPVYKPSRWLKQVPAVCYFGKGMLLCQAIPRALQNLRLKEEDNVPEPAAAGHLHPTPETSFAMHDSCR